MPQNEVQDWHAGLRFLWGGKTPHRRLWYHQPQGFGVLLMPPTASLWQKYPGLCRASPTVSQRWFGGCRLVFGAGQSPSCCGTSAGDHRERRCPQRGWVLGCPWRGAFPPEQRRAGEHRTGAVGGRGGTSKGWRCGRRGGGRNPTSPLAPVLAKVASWARQHAGSLEEERAPWRLGQLLRSARPSVAPVRRKRPLLGISRARWWYPNRHPVFGWVPRPTGTILVAFRWPRLPPLLLGGGCFTLLTGIYFWGCCATWGLF